MRFDLEEKSWEEIRVRPNQLNVLCVLCSLFKVIGDLGFLYYNQIYLLELNKTYSPLYNIYHFPDMQ